MTPSPTWDKRALLALAGLALLTACLPAAALRTVRADNVVVREDVDDDLAVVGQSVVVRGRVGGNLMAAGNTVRVEGPVAGSALVAGSQITLQGPVEGSLYAAGQFLEVSGAVGRNAYLAADRLDLTGTVARDAALGVSRGELTGTVAGRLWAAGQSIVLDGRVGGNLRFAGARLELGEQARVGGNVYYQQGTQVEVADSATIRGRVIARPAPAAPRRRLLAFGWWEVITALGLLVVALLSAAIWPVALGEAAQTIARRPGLALGVGALVILGGAVVALLALVTIIGIPLGLVLWAVWGLWLYLANVVVAAFLGGSLLRAFGAAPAHLVAASALGVLLLVLLRLIPVVGVVVQLLVWAAGVGAIASTSWWLARGRPAAEPAPPVIPAPEPPSAPTAPPG